MSNTERPEGWKLPVSQEPETEEHIYKVDHAVPGTDEPSEGHRTPVSDEPEVEGHATRVRI